jgi:hypothetical protein
MDRKRLKIPFAITAHHSLLPVISLTYSVPVFSKGVKDLWPAGFDKFQNPNIIKSLRNKE